MAALNTLKLFEVPQKNSTRISTLNFTYVEFFEALEIS